MSAPAFQFVLDVGQGGFAEGGVLALADLFLVVVKQAECMARQGNDGDEVEYNHKCHGQVYKAEGFAKGHVSAYQDHKPCKSLENAYRPLLAGYEPYIAFAVEVVCHNRAVCKQEDADCQVNGTELSQVEFHGVGGQYDAVVIAGVQSAEYDDECCAGAYQQGIHVNSD